MEHLEFPSTKIMMRGPTACQFASYVRNDKETKQSKQRSLNKNFTGLFSFMAHLGVFFLFFLS